MTEINIPALADSLSRWNHALRSSRGYALPGELPIAMVHFGDDLNASFRPLLHEYLVAHGVADSREVTIILVIADDRYEAFMGSDNVSLAVEEHLIGNGFTVEVIPQSHWPSRRADILPPKSICYGPEVVTVERAIGSVSSSKRCPGCGEEIVGIVCRRCGYPSSSLSHR